MLKFPTMKKLLPFLLLLAGCQSPQTVPVTPPPQISLKQVVDVFAHLPVKDAVIYDERTDPNGLLGRPGRYVEKMNFSDARLPEKRPECSIEVFNSFEDAKLRKEYIEAIGKASSPMDSYYFLHRNVLVRIDLKLIPSEAEEYKKALESL